MQLANPFCRPKFEKNRDYLPRKEEPHLPDIPEFVRLANTICALSQHRFWRKMSQIGVLKFAKSITEVSQAIFLRLAKPCLGREIPEERVYLLPKVKPHLQNTTKVMRLANTICALCQNRIWLNSNLPGRF